MHHAYTHVDGDDPDITGEIIRFHSLTRWHGHHKWQVISADSCGSLSFLLVPF